MTDPNHKKILDKVDASREQAIGFLQKMIAIPSVTGDEAAIQRFVSSHMKEIGLQVDLWETDWEALKKHPGYRPVQRGYEGRPNIVAC
jgi:acetylornithine deacetylase